MLLFKRQSICEVFQDEHPEVYQHFQIGTQTESIKKNKSYFLSRVFAMVFVIAWLVLLTLLVLAALILSAWSLTVSPDQWKLSVPSREVGE